MEPHELDVMSLVAGLIFLAGGVGHLLGLNVTRLWSDLAGLLPVVLIIAGAILIVRVLRHARDS